MTDCGTIITEEEIEKVVENVIRNSDIYHIDWEWAAKKGISEKIIREYSDFLMLNDWQDIMKQRSFSKDFRREFKLSLPNEDKGE